MKKIAFIAFCFFISSALPAQQATDLQEKVPYQYNGLEYGYYITNEKSKEVKGDDMDRYEIVLYVTNRSNSLRLIPFPNMDNVTDEVTIAEFSCKNATGKRLTSKNGKVSAKPWFTQVRVADEAQSSKYKFVKAQVGYAIKTGETISNKIIVIVPKGERPVVSCRTVDYPQI
jgi:hypothetical protein